jgi:hypothetical protein
MFKPFIISQSLTSSGLFEYFILAIKLCLLVSFFGPEINSNYAHGKIMQGVCGWFSLELVL